jgi:hypothetical protein
MIQRQLQLWTIIGVAACKYNVAPIDQPKDSWSSRPAPAISASSNDPIRPSIITSADPNPLLSPSPGAVTGPNFEEITTSANRQQTIAILPIKERQVYQRTSQNLAQISVSTSAPRAAMRYIRLRAVRDGSNLQPITQYQTFDVQLNRNPTWPLRCPVAAGIALKFPTMTRMDG